MMLPRAAMAAVAAAALAVSSIAATSAPPASCAAVPPSYRAPCGQTVDSEAACVAKGCCYDTSVKSSYPCYFAGAPAVPIKTVMVVQACHFDAGFADTTVNILNRYIGPGRYFEVAWEVGSALAGTQYGLRFMTQSWIASLFLDCPVGIPGLQCPSPAAVANFTAAVKAGYITWHAFPFNSELELADESMLRFGINLTHTLDDQLCVGRLARRLARSLLASPSPRSPLTLSQRAAAQVGAVTAGRAGHQPRSAAGAGGQRCEGGDSGREWRQHAAQRPAHLQLAGPGQRCDDAGDDPSRRLRRHRLRGRGDCAR